MINKDKKKNHPVESKRTYPLQASKARRSEIRRLSVIFLAGNNWAGEVVTDPLDQYRLNTCPTAPIRLL